jgi:hypothetical protein
MTTIWVDADGRIAHDASPGDIVVTADIPLAAILVAKGISAVDLRGDVHTSSTGRGVTLTLDSPFPCAAAHVFHPGLRPSHAISG